MENAYIYKPDAQASGFGASYSLAGASGLYGRKPGAVRLGLVWASGCGISDTLWFANGRAVGPKRTLCLPIPRALPWARQIDGPLGRKIASIECIRRFSQASCNA